MRKIKLLFVVIFGWVFSHSQDTDANYSLAKEFYEDKNYEKAEEVLLNIIENDPSYYRAYSSLGTVYILLNDTVAAHEYALKGFQMAPKEHGAIRHYLATLMDMDSCNRIKDIFQNTSNLELKNDIDSFEHAYSAVMYSYCIAEETPTIAFEEINKAITLTDDPYPCYAKASICREHEIYQEAEELLIQNIANYPDEYDNYHLLAECYADQEQYVKAIPLYAQALKRSPANPGVMYDLAWTYYLADSFDASIITINRFLAITNDSIESYKLMGLNYSYSEQVEKLDSVIQIINRINRFPADELIGLKFESAVLKDDLEGIFMHGEDLLDFVPDDTYVLSSIAGALYDHGNYELCLGYYERAIAAGILEEEWPLEFIYVHIGYSLQEQNDYSAAIDTFTKHINHNPNDIDGYYWRGICYEATEDFALAKEDLTKVLLIEPNDKDAKKALKRVEKMLK